MKTRKRNEISVMAVQQISAGSIGRNYMSDCSRDASDSLLQIEGGIDGVTHFEQCLRLFESDLRLTDQAGGFQRGAQLARDSLEEQSFTVREGRRPRLARFSTPIGRSCAKRGTHA